MCQVPGSLKMFTADKSKSYTDSPFFAQLLTPERAAGNPAGTWEHAKILLRFLWISKK